MSQCLHCGQSCAEHAVFCEECQIHAGKIFQLENPDQPAFSAAFSPTTPYRFGTQKDANGEPLGAVTVPFEPSDDLYEEDISQVTTLVLGDGLSSSDQALNRLSAAARRIAEEEASEPHFKRSLSARLKPLRDISADIQRASTPHPLIKPSSPFDTQPEANGVGRSSVQQATPVVNNHASSLWPWFNAVEEDEKTRDSDLWANSTDPFVSRVRPTINEGAYIEEADIRRVQIEEHATMPDLAVQSKHSRLSRWRLAFVSMVILALVALAIDGLLLSFAFKHANHGSPAQAGPPTLVLSTNIANSGDIVTVQLTHFAPSTTVALTHDVQETLFTTDDVPSLTINASGGASTTFSVASTWGPGFHLIVAEDVATRDTASAMLQIYGEGPSRPPHLLLDNASIDLGDAVQGASTIQPLVLHNAGGGSISWSVSSNQPWLLVAPAQGLFSTGQSISIAAQRNHLPPGGYKGTITIFSSVGAPETVPVSMKVSPLPPNAGPVISLAPPLLSFTTTDGSSTPEMQTVTLSNPGQQSLHWSLTSGTTTATTMQSVFLQLPEHQRKGLKASSFRSISPWLSADLTSGELASGRSVLIHFIANSQNVLPGAYMEPLTFSSLQPTEAYDNPQVMNVALTVQPRCGLLAGTGILDFTAVAGQSNPSSHALSLSATSSCGSEVLNWQAASSANWITVSPANGQLKGTDTSITSIGVNIANLNAGRYKGVVTFQAGKSTQTVTVQLNLQPHPAPSEPIMGASPLSLNFSTIQGQATPAGQVVTITNNGGSPLKWHTNILLQGTSWLNVTPTGGIVLPGQTGQVNVNVATEGLTPGTYTGQVTLSATDTRGSPASGSPQAITISLIVEPPCTLAQPSASSLLFNATAGGANPLMQVITLMSSGSCVWPVHWNANVSSAAPWLTLTSPNGALNTLAQQASIGVGVNISGLQPGSYSTQVRISAVDSAGMQAQSSPQSFSVTLTILQPCTLQPLPAQIVLNASAGQATPASQAFTLSETGSCSGGVVWTASGDADSSAWLGLSTIGGTDNGSGSTITVSASALSLAPGNYTGQITVSANNNGLVLQGSPQTVQVTLHVAGYTVSGTVAACANPAPDCSISQGLPGATVSLIDGNDVTVAVVTADASGNFTFTNIAPGSYKISASGSSGPISYVGTANVSVNGNTAGVSVSTFSS